MVFFSAEFIGYCRMYSLVSRITEGLKELKLVLEEHIHNQGVSVIEKCGDAALNVSGIYNDVELPRLVYIIY